MPNKSYFRAVAAAVVLSAAFMAPALAQQPPDDIPTGMPEGIVTGPAPGEIPSGDEGMPTIPQADIPGIPAEARGQLDEASTVEIYCLMTKWKSGDFFSMLEAMDENFRPVIDQVVAEGIDVRMPGLAAMKAQGESKLGAVCGAKTIDEANAAAHDFQALGESVRSQFVAFRGELVGKMQAKGDALRAKIQSEIETFVQGEREKIEDELKGLADKEAEAARAQMESEMSQRNFTSGEQAQAYVNSRVPAIKRSIEAKITAVVDERKKTLTTSIEARVGEIVGAEKGRFEALGASLKAAGAKIESGIEARRGQYDTYRDQAFAKRKAVVLGVVDKALAEAKAEIEANRAEFEKAKQGDSGAVTVEAIEAEMTRDRAALEAALDRALASGNDAAFTAAADAFRDKWQGYREKTEKAFKSVTRICALVGAQVTAALPKLDQGVRDIELVQNKCWGLEGDSRGQCERIIMELSPRLTSILEKSKSLRQDMTAVTGLCGAVGEGDASSDALLARLDEMRKKGEDLKTLGEALQAEKATYEEMARQSAQAGCASALPRIKAGRLSMQESTKDLQGKLADCRGKKGDVECDSLAKLKPQVDSLQAKVSAAEGFMKRVESACASLKADTPYEEILALFGEALAKADDFASVEKSIRYEAAQLSSPVKLCAAAQPMLDAGAQEFTRAIETMKAKRDKSVAVGVAACRKNQSQSGCDEVKKAQDRMAEAERLYKDYSTQYWDFTRLCRKAYGSDATRATLSLDDLVNRAKELKRRGDDLRAADQQAAADLTAVEKAFR
jgi:hypothetical protein